MFTRQYYVYIVTNTYNTVFYTGVTNNLIRRIHEHINKLIPGFTKRYNIWKLVYYEVTEDVMSAIEREKQIKDYRREKKLALVKSMNPSFQDLYPEIIKQN